MFLGKICEYGNTQSIYENPQHPYTKSLLDAAPKADPTMRKEKKTILTGEIPSPINPPSGCRFRTRCPIAKNVCAEEEPKLRDVQGRLAACHQLQQNGSEITGCQVC